MATRTPWAGAVVDGEVANDDDFNSLPGGCIAYAMSTSAQGSITTEVALTGLSVAPTLVANRLYKAEVVVHAKSDASDDRIRVILKKDGTAINDCRMPDVTANLADTFHAWALVVGPSAGSATFTATIQRSAGSGTVTTESSAASPAIIAVYDMGPSF